MNFNIPMSDVGMITGILGAFFLLVAFYKSLFHSRRPPEEVAIEAMEAQRKREKEDALRVNISDPFAQTAPEEERQEVSQHSDTQKVDGDPKPAPVLSAFRQLAPTGMLGEITVKNSDLYQWE
ncbi:MAG: hypothetical protein WCP12_11350 [bacterium]